jgi:hypothetical protein
MKRLLCFFFLFSLFPSLIAHFFPVWERKPTAFQCRNWALNFADPNAHTFAELCVRGPKFVNASTG